MSVVILQDQIDRVGGVELVLLDPVRLAQRLPPHLLDEDAMAQAKHVFERIPIQNGVLACDNVNHFYRYPGLPLPAVEDISSQNGPRCTPPVEGYARLCTGQASLDRASRNPFPDNVNYVLTHQI